MKGVEIWARPGKKQNKFTAMASEQAEARWRAADSHCAACAHTSRHRRLRCTRRPRHLARAHGSRSASKCQPVGWERRTHIDPDSHASWAFNNRRDGGSRHYQMFDPSWSTESHGWIQSQKMSEMLIDGRCKTDFGPPSKSLMHPLWVCSI